MKKLIILLLSVCIVSCLCLTACGGNEDATIVDQSATETATDHSESGQSDAVIILQYKTTAKNKLDEMVNPVVKVVSQEDLKSAIVNYYNSEKNYIEGIIDLDTAKAAAEKVVADTKAFALNTLKPLAIQKLNEVVNPLIENIAYDEIKNTVQSFYNTEMGKVAELETLSDVAGFYKVIFEDVKSLLVEETQKALVALKNKAIGELDTYLSALIEKIPYDGLKTDIITFYTTEKEKIQAVDTIEGVSPCVNEIKGDLQTFALTETKTLVLSALDEIVNPVIATISQEDIKSAVVTYYNNEKQYVTDINDMDTAKEAAGKVVSDTKAFALNTLKPLAIQKLNEVVNPLIENIAYDEIKNTVQSFYDTEMGKVAELESLSDVAGFYKVIFEDVKSLLVEETQKALVALKNKAIGELDTYLSALIEKIPYDGLKTDIRTFYTTEKEKIQAVDTIEGVTPCLNEIKGDLQTFAITETKTLVLSALDEIVNPVIATISQEDIKSAVVTYYNNEKQYVTDINDMDTAKEAAGKVVSDTKAFALNTLKPLAIQKLNEVVNPLIENIAYDEIKNTVQSFYNTEMGKVAELETLSDVAGFYKVIFEDVKTLLTEETQKALVALKNKAIGELDTYLSALIEKIPYDGLKTDIRTFYTTEKEKIQAVDTIEGVTPCVNEIKGDLQTFALTETKKIALSQLDEIVNAALDKMPNEELRDDLTAFYAVEKAKINAVTEVQNVPATLSTVISETSAHIKELLASTVKNYFARLTQVENTTAYDYLPAAMLPTYQNNLVTASDINYDFTEFTSVSAISKAGYGEQWQMVLENVAQSASMAKVFNVAQTVLTAAGNAVDIYVTNSYSEEINYVFDTEDYSGNFTFDGSMLAFRITLKKSISVPGFGSVRPQIKMEYDLSKDAKGMFISLGDACKVKYVVSDNAYEMATTYQVTAFEKTGSRTAYLSIERLSGGTTVGHIYEYTTYEGNDLIKSCADFYINDQFVSVVGNKASGMIGYDGYVNELYKTDEGRLLGYEVREEKTIAGITATYNTLWFNLWDVQGLNTVKVTDKTKDNKSSLSTVNVYLNGSSTLLSPTYNTKIIKTSRKYDIELRSRFYYTYDAENNAYVANEVSVPMLFVQEGDNFNSFTSDIQKDNGVAASIVLNSVYLDKILLDYDTLIDVFIANKDNTSSEKIIEYLGGYED